MESDAKASPRFVPDRLPWLIAAAALLVYLVTLNPWVRLDSVGNVSRVGGWDPGVTLQSPLLLLLALPLRLLPMSVQAVALNGLTAVMAALTLYLLARSVALLPFDRTREARLRERSDDSRLSLPAAWVPVVLAAALCAFQLSFWEHATAVTGEMLDLLVFAYLVRCLLEFRLDRRERWLLKFAFVYGLGVANNYAMIPFFPCALIAVIWVKGWEALDWKFWVRLVVAGLIGLLLYLFLPLMGLLRGDMPFGPFEHLRAILGMQKSSLQALPGYVILILSFTSILPVFFLSIRWAEGTGDTSAAGAALTTFLVTGVQLVLLVGCGAVFFEMPWSGRRLGFGFALLPFYYLAALSVGYFCGYFMLIARSFRGRSWTSGPKAADGRATAVAGLAMAVMVAAPAVLLVRNYPALRVLNSGAMAQLADNMVASLPTQGVYVLADVAYDLLLLDARLHHARGANPHVLVHSRSLEFSRYHQQLAKRYPHRWPFAAELAGAPDPIDGTQLMTRIASLAASNEVYYLNPSFGYYFELVRLVPHGVAYRVEALRNETLTPPALTAKELTPTQEFWEKVAPGLASLRDHPGVLSGLQYPNVYYARALNHWGVTLQRQGNANAAARWFELAAQLNPKNQAARVNTAFNEALRKGGATPTEVTPAVDLPAEYRTWNDLLLETGPLDDPRWTHTVAGVFARAGLYRQALIEFARVQTLAPTNTSVRLWRDNMEIMTRLRLGDAAGAEKEALGLQTQFPRDPGVCEVLTQIYLATGRITNALASVERQLALAPADANGLLNKAAIHIQLAQFAQAIPPLDALLKLQPQNTPALLNRAIAHLQSGNLERAQADYLALLRFAPDSPAVQFGLGEIAVRQKDTGAALTYYGRYLKLGQKGSDEYKAVAQRFEELKGGGRR